MENIIIQNTTATPAIRYRVERNAAASKTCNHDVYTALTEVKECYDLNRVASRMIERGCAVKKSSIALVLNDFAELVSDLVAEGYAVNIPGLVRFAPAIRGTFASIDAPWDASAHQIVVNATVGSRMRIAAAQSNVQRVQLTVLPKPEQLIDMTTQRANVITSEGSFLVTGTQLMWDEAAEDEGWYLLLGGEEIKCTALETEEDGTCVVLQTDRIFEAADLPLELFFRTRINGTLHQVKYHDAIVTATRA